MGASLPDFDHNIKKANIYKLIIVSFIILFFLHTLKLPYTIGIIFISLPIIFYFSNHRGFTHSILGITILSILIFGLVIIGASIILQIINSIYLLNITFSSELISIILIISAISIFFLNKKILFSFLILFLVATILFYNILPIHNANFSDFLYYNPFLNSLNIDYNMLHYNYQMIILILIPLIFGFLSHLILDSLTPNGIELFNPFSSKRVYKNFGIFCLAFLGALLILTYFNYF